MSIIHFFCEPGYTLPKRHHWSKCHHGEWHPKVPVCVPRLGKRKEKMELRLLVPKYLSQPLQSNDLLSFEVRDLCKRLEAARADSFLLHQLSNSSAFWMKQMCWERHYTSTTINKWSKLTPGTRQGSKVLYQGGEKPWYFIHHTHFLVWAETYHERKPTAWAGS